MKTLAIRLDEELHAQLAVMAQLTSTSITDLIRTAITNHLTTLRNDPSLASQAESVIAEIDREAGVRRDAISTLFDGAAPKGQRRGRRPADAGE